MRNSLKNTAAVFMLVALTGVAGCATTRDLDVLKAQVETAQATANKAAADAAAALAKANAAQACCDANSEKMDRIFKQSMNK
jgi:murein lipoprotein